MTKPSWQDFATHDESIVPELWDGVVGAWAPCLGPTGSRLHDMSKRANWGTLTNMDPPTDWVVSDGQYALDFDGSNDYIQHSSLGQFVAGQITVAAWVSFRNFATAPQCIISNFLSGQTTFQLEFSRTAGRLSFLQNGGTVGITSTQSINDAGWRRVAVTRAGTTGAWAFTAFINREITTATTAQNPDASPGPIVIGRPGNFNGQYINAMISEVTVWNRPLSISEMNLHFELGRGGMYQRRRRSRIYIPQAGFQAAWARGSNVLLGFNQP